MIRNLYEVLAEADSKPKAKSKETAKKPIPREEPILTVKLVDGKKTRDTIAVDFIGGGHELAYPGIIPKGEVWIEQDLAPDEQVDILVHELIEYALMSKGGMTYTPAHNMANKLEKVFRGFEGRWKTKQAPGGDKKVEEGLIAESYSMGLMAFLRYLKAGIDPHDFAHEIESFYEDLGEDPPESFDVDEPYNFLDTPEFEEVKADFIKYLETHISPNMADLPTYLFLSGAKLLPRQTWLIHFSDDAGDIAEDGFEFGAEDFTQIGLTTHMTDNKRRQGPGWNFALKADDRDVKFASKKYGEEAVMFQSAGVEAYHQGDNEQQVVFWGPNVKERFYLQNDGGDWVVKNPFTDKELVRSGNIFDAIGWVKQNHAQYNKVITNNQKTKPIQPTPAADREKLLAKPPEKTPQPFESETPRRSCPKCKSTNILYGPKDQPNIKWRGSAECGDCGHHGSAVGGGFPLVKEDEETPGTCLKCGLAKHRSIPHLCPKGRSKWGAKGGKFTTPERPAYKTKAVTEGVEDLLVVVKQYASNKHPDDHVPEDYHWAREKAFNTEGLIHMMPGGLAGWRSFLGDAVKESPDKYTKLAKAEKIDDPVIVSPGHIWDGWHRIAAAIVNGHKTIPAIVGKLNAR